MRRIIRYTFAVLFGCSLGSTAFPQTAQFQGRVTDSSQAVVVGAEVRIFNQATGVERKVKTNSDGLYTAPFISPGTYQIYVQASGFSTVSSQPLTVTVGQSLVFDVQLKVGSTQQQVTVESGSQILNTTDGSVSTVIDRSLVAALPLNGRSFNTLLQLTPGVVIAPTNSYDSGQFSVAGQRTEANNFLVDGVSANFGISSGASLGSGGGGSSQAMSALGGTSSLVSVEALQEFRVETSSFAPEFGRSPGGQVIITTRSGTNDPHGGVYDYFRNDALDANDWFANHAGLGRAPEKHNDFGAFLGAALQKNKTFVFLSYEGARLRQPNTTVVEVPSAYARQIVPTPIAPFILAYPKPNDLTPVPGVYTSAFVGNFSNPSSLNAGSVRIDRTLSDRWSIFGRYNESPSSTAVRSNSLNELDTTSVGTRTITVSATGILTPTTTDTLRGNYSKQASSSTTQLTAFGGSTVPSINVLLPNLPNANGVDVLFGTFDTGFYSQGPNAQNQNTQLNFADDLALSRHAHQLKFGADYRAIYMDLGPAPIVEYLVSSVSNFIATSSADYGIFGFNALHSRLTFPTASIYGQDTWKATDRLTLTYGVRWEFSPAPAPRGTTILAAFQNVADPSQLSLAPPGTALWNTSYDDFAPRIGVAYKLRKSGDLVLRAGWGIFYDLGTDAVGYLGSTYPNSSSSVSSPAQLPLTDAANVIPSISSAPPYPDGTAGFDPNLKLPRSYQWNMAVEKSFAGQHVVTVTYVGQAGRGLLRQEGLEQPNASFAGAFLLTANHALSNYDALQFQYRLPLSGRLHGLLNYSWSHSMDDASDDTIEATAISSTVLSSAEYASSTFDVRHSLSGALDYAIPEFGKRGFLSGLTRDWSIDATAVVRSGFPFNLEVVTATIAGVYPRPNQISGQPLWISNPSAGGGKSINPNAFAAPANGLQGTESRNNIRGFGLTQLDLSFGRKFSITDRTQLQFRTDAFNLLNHPNFSIPSGYFGEGATALESASMLNRGLGGLNPLFQEGGPRSLQLSLKLTF